MQRRAQGTDYATMEHTADFKVAQTKKVEHPTAEQVAEKEKKWGWEG